jgi:putative transcriptional regulator
VRVVQGPDLTVACSGAVRHFLLLAGGVQVGRAGLLNFDMVLSYNDKTSSLPKSSARARGSTKSSRSPSEAGDMGIRVNLDHLLLDRKLTLTELADRIGITIANLSVLKTNKAKAMRFSTLEALCRELDCQPGELLEYERAQGPSGRRTGVPVSDD